MAHDWMTRLDWAGQALKAVRSACWSYDRNNVEDICQETFAALAKQFAGPSPPPVQDADELAKYAYVVAYRIVLDRAKRNKRLVTTHDLGILEAGQRPARSLARERRGPDPGSLTDKQHAKILALVPKGNTQLREVVRLHLQGQPGAEIARAIGISPATVSRRLDEAEQLVRNNIDQLLE